jgi:hypothetical protein
MSDKPISPLRQRMIEDMFASPPKRTSGDQGEMSG